MEIDQSIVQLGEKLDGWCKDFFAMLGSKNQAARGRALLRGVAIMKELDALKARGLAAITALLARQGAMPEGERTASLIQGFEFAAKLRHTLSDELSDTDGVNKTVDLMNEIANALDASGTDARGSGRAVLAVLLDHPDARVRASAGAYLINLMPDRVLPILREVREKEHANSAHFTAHWAIRGWELDGSRGKS
ncbi:MAG TPA: hypothetical protein VK430_00730 [Xanthobacteraceae bacterium]|nr:hypothetical protein [Xanthobacteraceae bacterium]